MTEIRDNEVEALSRALSRQTILNSGWYPSLRDVERRKLIERDVNFH